MEGLEAGLMDDIFNFSMDIGVGDDDDVVGGGRKPRAAPLSSSSSSSPKPNDDRSAGGPFPEVDEEEEELPWLLNKDAFPGVETCFDLLSSDPGAIVSFPKQPSPVSVLETGNAGIGADILSCVPVKARSKSRRRRRQRFPDIPSEPSWWFNQENIEAPKLERPRKAASGRKCQHCQADKTPQWRAGPMGPKTLCNACGVRYKSGRLVPEYRPASSPTFSTQLHSNSHRKIMEMRKKQVETG